MKIVMKIVNTFARKQRSDRMPTLEELNQENRRKNRKQRKQFLENRRQIEAPDQLPKKKKVAST